MSKQEFHLGDILSITTGRLVSPERIVGVYNILTFMAGCSLSAQGMIRAGDEYAPKLAKQFPQLVTPEMDSAVAELVAELDSKETRPEREVVTDEWLAKQVAKYGKMFVVEAP